MKKWSIMGIFLVIMLVIITACSTPAPTTTSAPSTTAAPSTTVAPKPTTSAPPATTTAAPTSTAAAQSVADFYAKNPVTMICTQGAGGGVDYLGRMFAAFWPDLTGGGSMIIKNAATQMIGANSIYAAKPDGLTWGVTVLAGPMVGPVLSKDPAVAYDLAKFNWIGLVGQDPYALVFSTKSPVNTIDEMKAAKNLKFAAETNSGGAMSAALMIDILGLEGAKVITGYGGFADISLAIGRGEVDAYVGPSSAANDDIKKGFAKKPLMVMDTRQSAWWKDTKSFPEVIKMTPDQDRYFGICMSLNAGRPYFMPPGVAADKVKFARDIFDKMVVAKGFKEMGVLRWPVWETPLTGEQTAAIVKKFGDIPQADVDKFLAIVKKYT